MQALLLVPLLFTGAIFGFFFAWVCSTMWGLDASDPRIAITAMQNMNASVRNAVFFPAFFLTPIVQIGAAVVFWWGSHSAVAIPLALAAAVYLAGAFLPTALVNVPMNEALAAVAVPDSMEEAQAIWRDYSGRWQAWNIARTFGSGLSLLLVGWAMLSFQPLK
ncbi:MAG: anthrone oxygenase family protein [Pseudomonadota bacterium]